MVESLKQIPVGVWLVGAAVVIVTSRCATLAVGRSPEALRRLVKTAKNVRRYCQAHAGRCPESLEVIEPGARAEKEGAKPQDLP